MPNTINTDLEGKELKYFPQKPSEEIKKFSNVNLHSQPDSKRTLNPEYAPRRFQSKNNSDFNKESKEDNSIIIYKEKLVILKFLKAFLLMMIFQIILIYSLR